jgi:hypothetical protein
LNLDENYVLILDCTGNIGQWDTIRAALFGPNYFPVVVFDVDFNVIHGPDQPDLGLQKGFKSFNF